MHVTLLLRRLGLLGSDYKSENIELSIRLVAPGENDGPQFSLPTCDELAVLVVGDFTLEAPCRDIIVHARGGDLQRGLLGFAVPSVVYLW